MNLNEFNKILNINNFRYANYFKKIYHLAAFTFTCLLHFRVRVKKNIDGGHMLFGTVNQISIL